MKLEIGQLLMIGISGPSLTNEEKRFIVDQNIGGITLFGRNYKEPRQLHALCTEIQNLRHLMPNKTPLYIAIDMEGGRVARLKSPFTVWPPARRLGEVDSAHLSFEMAQAMGQELRAFGINVDWAPCADVLTNPSNTAIGDRAISADPEIVGKHASALVRGYLKAGVNPCLKHFPGHGNTLVDSHEELPVENLDKARLDAVELIPFKKALRARGEMLMTCHILFPKIDAEFPATLSKKFLQDILRGELRYRGLIVTDDLGMKAMSKNYPAAKIPILALQAGADILLYCNEPETPPVALESIRASLQNGELNPANIQVSLDLIREHKIANLKNPDPLPLADALSVLGSPKHAQVAEDIAAGRVSDASAT